MNSLVSSASLVLVRIVFDVRWRNSASARSPATGIVRADDLGQRAQLLEGVALGDPLRAERDVHLEPAILEGRGDVLRRARVHGAAQDDERTVRDVRRDLVHRPLEHAHGWAQELVHGRADHQDHGVRAGHHRGGRAHLEAAGREDTRQQLVRAVLQERHLPAGDALQGGAVDVEDAHPQAGLDEGEAQRQADVARAAEHDDVERGGWSAAGLVATVSVMRCTLATPAAPGGLPEGTSVTAPFGHRARTRIVPSASSHARSHGPDGVASPAGTTTTSAAQRSSTSPASGPCSAA